MADSEGASILFFASLAVALLKNKIPRPMKLVACRRGIE